LQWLCANDVGKPPGRLTYTQLLNDRGGIECDLTVSRLAEESFYIVTGTGFRTRDHDWISRHIPTGSNVDFGDVTEDLAVLALMGPEARLVLQQVTEADVSDAALPFGHLATLTIAGAKVRALRVTYVGELGWELHVPRASATDVYDSLMSAGRPYGLVNAGYRAIESLRLEKGYRAWGSDIGPDHTPLEAGLGWAVKLGGDIPFIGRDAIAAQKAAGPPERLACFTVDDPDITLLGRETIYRDGLRAGWLTSGGWGYTVETNIGYGYVDGNGTAVDADYLGSGNYELEVATRRVPCAIHLGVLYDPQMSRVKA
jgi:4-methylaminobutanoate oxidase (formaldehyde-forming)